MNKQKNGFVHKVADFARQYILVRPGLGREEQFPTDIWKAMGECGLLDPHAKGIDTASPCQNIASGAMALVENGGNLGLSLSWMIHHLVSRYLVYPYLNNEKLPGFWDDIRSGKSTICLAVSEPKAGAHPKFMSVQADKKDDFFILSGQKTYLTNGPISDYFLVVAITGQTQGRKEFSAFLVDKEAPGLKVEPPMDIPFFKPSPHGGITMEECRVSTEKLVGTPGSAYEEMVLPFRRLEDAAMTGSVAGAMRFILAQTAKTLGNSGSLEKETHQALGNLKATTDAAVYLSGQISCLADAHDDQDADPLMDSLVIHFKETASLFMTRIKEFWEKAGHCPDSQVEILAKDLLSSSKIGKTVSGIKQQKMGQRLLDLTD
ncbi:MAG: acyl-CoA dehydrogenase family protein [Desulfobacterales bacterium]|nr:acyl-CoA dehydrogenase family protein [Desulfobacterales bacterium]